MRIKKFAQVVISLLVVINISACGQIKSFFPDKEKDYQFSREIPALSIPSDLSDHAVQDKPTATASDVNANVLPATQSGKEKSSDKEEAIYVDLIQYSAGATRILIGDSLERSWRIVGRALSRHSIEIIDRNEAERIYFVQYDADFKKVEDGSLWDEVLFIFAADPAQEKEFRITLAEKKGMTEVIVLDSNDKPLSSGAGLKLLNLLYKTIQQDLAI